MNPPGIPTRAAALALIEGVSVDGLPLSELLASEVLEGLPPQERARAQRLAVSTLRNISRADTVLKPHLRRNPPARIRAILHLGTTEMLAEGAAPHGVVNACVDLVRQGGIKAESFAGLVNAVLRKVSETAPEKWAALPPQQLAGWLRGRLMSAYGKADVQRMEAAHQAGAPIDLTPGNGDGAGLAERVGGILLPTGSVRTTGGQVTALPGYGTGDWWVQDAAAAVAARALASAPGERIADLCAAPGGKTLQLAAAGADVTAVDISGLRMDRVAQNLGRCGLTARLIVADALDWQPEAPFDAVLLDAPCSATGTIRRHPDLPFVKDADALKTLFALQSRLIDSALAMLPPGGRLAFCTCSLLPEEGERQITGVLGRHPGLRTDPAAFILPGIQPEWVTPEGGLRLRPDYWPDMGGMDGFYIAVLRRSA